MTRLSFCTTAFAWGLRAGACRMRTEGLARMGALRKAGVWLGLVEEDDDRHREGVFDDDFADDEDYAPPARPRSLSRPAQRSAERDLRAGARDPRPVEREAHDSRLADREATIADHDPRMSHREPRMPESRTSETRVPERDRRLADREVRLAEQIRPERAGVRQLTRPSSGAGYQTQDNLALAPQVQPRERGVVTDDKNCRYQITTLHPTTYNEARTIGEHFRDGYPVIMNLTEMDEPDAKRLVDFAAGLAFGLRGSMERVTNRVFLLSPPNIQVSAEDKARIAEGGFFNGS